MADPIPSHGPGQPAQWATSAVPARGAKRERSSGDSMESDEAPSKFFQSDSAPGVASSLGLGDWSALAPLGDAGPSVPRMPVIGGPMAST